MLFKLELSFLKTEQTLIKIVVTATYFPPLGRGCMCNPGLFDSAELILGHIMIFLFYHSLGTSIRHNTLFMNKLYLCRLLILDGWLCSVLDIITIEAELG